MTQKFIKTVTVTGADNNINISSMCDIQRRFPFVEFGILLSEKHSSGEGASRFPGAEWLNQLAACPFKLNLAGHLCGKWARGVLIGNQPPLHLITPTLGGLFSRFQINTHGEVCAASSEFCSELLEHYADAGQEIIFQLDSVMGTVSRLQKFREAGFKNTSGLIDMSHGAGVLPESWPAAGIPWIGYAGGLSPENLAAQIALIHTACGGAHTWIDAETHLRTGGGFDLKKVVAFLEIAAPFVI